MFLSFFTPNEKLSRNIDEDIFVACKLNLAL